MTEAYYKKLLQYLNTSEKQAFLSCLEKKKFKVDGYRTLEKAPPLLLARLLTKNEATVIHALKDLGDNYSSIEEALADFRSGNVIKTYSFIVSNQEVTEEQLIAIMDAQSESVPSDADKTIERLQAALFDLSTKHQELKKEYTASKKKVNALVKENDKLEKELKTANDSIIRVSADAQKAEATITSQAREYDQKISGFVQQIQELKKENEELRAQNREAAKAPILVLLKERVSIPLNWVLVRTYDFVASLNNENAVDYSEILYVYNEMPLSLRIKIQRIEEAQRKVKTFTTNHELLNYVKEARK